MWVEDVGVSCIGILQPCSHTAGYLHLCVLAAYAHVCPEFTCEWLFVSGGLDIGTCLSIFPRAAAEDEFLMLLILRLNITKLAYVCLNFY